MYIQEDSKQSHWPGCGRRQESAHPDCGRDHAAHNPAYQHGVTKVSVRVTGTGSLNFDMRLPYTVCLPYTACGTCCDQPCCWFNRHNKPPRGDPLKPARHKSALPATFGGRLTPNVVAVASLAHLVLSTLWAQHTMCSHLRCHPSNSYFVKQLGYVEAHTLMKALRGHRGTRAEKSVR